MRAWCLALVLLVGGVAHADKAKARELFRDGTQHFKLGEYQAALDSFKEAYRNFEDPSFLFNIAQCHRQLDHKQEAIKLYRTYLTDAPNAPNADDVRKVIASLEEAVRQEEAARRVPPQDTVAPTSSEPVHPEPTPVVATSAPASQSPSRTPIYKRWWLWTAVGVVVAVGLGVGLGVGLTSSGPSAPSAMTTGGTFRPF
jgi:tetratricopeptide (TPR) repeat protein